DRVTFHRIRTDRVWTRDSGPITLVHRDPSTPEPRLALDWKFNAWAKYDNYSRDDRVTARVADRLGLARLSPRRAWGEKSSRVVLEGGAIDVNGQGTLLTTEECLLSEIQARNPELARTDYERIFLDYLGARHVIWLGRGIVGDDTHGHVDDLARFVTSST